MKKVIILALFCAVAAFAQTYKVGEKPIAQARILNNLLVNCEFDKAYKMTDQLLEKYPSEPLYYYLAVAAIGLKNLDFNEVLDREKFFEIYDVGIRLVEAMLEDDPTSCDLIMLRGFLMSANAAFLLLEGRLAAGARLGLRSLEILRQAHACDPKNYDTQYYLGFFDYAQAELRRRLGPLGVFTGLTRNPQQGITALERCVRYARFMNRAAEMVLVDVYVRENRLDKAGEMLPRLLKEFPESRFLMWTQKRYYIARGDDLAAINIALTASRLYFRDGGYHNGVMILEETRKASNFRRFPAEIRRQIAELEPLINTQRVSSSTMRTFRSMIRE
ncbi:MAG: hypothetical protein FWE23_01050 [Chitinivibrionia bacterium]|nr:hypothetical protein [Chitinivibrionia bacterium]